MITSTKLVTVGIAGNPNCGKTTLFNALTGGTQRIGNWPGVTVEKKEGTITHGDNRYNLVDLPGIYSLAAKSEDEKVARDYVLSGEPDLVINILDATNLERNLFLTTHLLEMKVPVLVVLNMMDLAEKNNIKIDLKHLEKHLGCPVIGISAVNKEDIEKCKGALDNALKEKTISEFLVEYPDEIESVIERWSPGIAPTSREFGVDNRWVALKILESDPWITEKVVAMGDLNKDEIKNGITEVEKLLKDSPDIILADSRYGMIHGVCRDTVKRKATRRGATEVIDKVVMNRVLGIPIFLTAMYLMFWVTITVGGAFIDFFDIFFGAIFVDGFGSLLGAMNVPETVITILAGGVGAGIQTVATFIPIIFTMFFMLSLLEDSGYMARAAFVVDRFMHWIGLPGKSFVPMLVGFGCTVPAIMATRTLESRKDRYMTIFMAPFMSCGARLPVYALFGAAFFGAASGLVVFSLYLAGIILAVLTGLLLKGTLFKGEPSHFIMELPPYHAPRLRHIFHHTWIRLKIFMLRAGKVIVLVVALLAFFNSLGIDGSFGNEDNEKSVLAKAGKVITPVFKPMGITDENWPATVGLFTGLFAKEAVVGTLNSLYSQIDAAESEGMEEEAGFEFWPSIGEAFVSIGEGLSGIFSGLADPLGTGMISADESAVAEEVEADLSVFVLMRQHFSKTGAYAYLLFILLYFPCVAALGVAVREMGAKYGWILAGYLTLLGWIVATLFYQVVEGHSFIWIIVPLLLQAGIYVLFRILGRKMKLQESKQDELLIKAH
jgi:ferrous iron transport protein B